MRRNTVSEYYSQKSHLSSISCLITLQFTETLQNVVAKLKMALKLNCFVLTFQSTVEKKGCLLISSTPSEPAPVIIGNESDN